MIVGQGAIARNSEATAWQSGRDWLPALVAALILHLLLCLAAAGLIVRRPTAQQPFSVAVTLVGQGPTGRAAPSAKTSADPLERLQKEVSTAEHESTTTSPRLAPATSLSDLLGEARPKTPPGGGGPSAPAAGSGDVGQIDPYAYASLSPSMAKLAADRSLRDQALRCWLRPATPRLVKVRVTLNGRGVLTARPVALGSPLDALDPVQADAAARAVAAVRDCAPFVAPPVQTPTTYDLEFP